MKTTYPGIDYSLGTANVDHATGIHYGVIGQGTVGEAWYESAEPQYGEPTCPECGSAINQEPDDDGNVHCTVCPYTIDEHRMGEECYGDEPNAWTYDDDGYKLETCLDSDIMVLKSRYYTHAQFCSPCVPGAGNLESECDDGPKTYALGHDWFEEGRAPYRLFSVETGEEVLS